MNALKKILAFATTAKAKRSAMVASLAAIFAIALPGVAAAASASVSTDFDTALNMVIDWSQGTLGKLVSVTFLVVGIVMGVMRQSIFAAVPAIAAAMTLYIGPDIIDSIFAATL